jgi:hypothetical protein
MQRLIVIYAALLAAGTMLWPSLRGTGLFDLPGDMVFQLDGGGVGVPFATSFLIASVVSGVWRLLEP